MKIPLAVYCIECKHDNTVTIDLGDVSLDFVCAKCSYRHSGGFDLRFTIGDRLFRRAVHKARVNHDPSMSIVCSAMALECEVSRLHHKWERIGARLTSFTEVTQDELDERLRRYGNIAARLEAVARMMHSAGMEDFVANDVELRTTISKGFSSVRLGSLAADFQQQLFWPRNRVLHLGFSGFSEADGNRCLNIALLGLKVFEQLDLKRRESV